MLEESCGNELHPSLGPIWQLLNIFGKEQQTVLQTRFLTGLVTEV